MTAPAPRRKTGFFPSLFGPILLHDLVSSARRGRYLLIRCLYVAALLVMLFLVYAGAVGRATGSPLDVFTAASIDTARVAAFNEDFFEKFMTVQFLVIVLLTPGVTAGAVAEEKDRKTLEYLLATDLHSHEIVLGKLASRLGYMTLVLLTGLPVLSVMQLLGGVDPQLMLAGFAATAATTLSLAALSLLNSVYATKPRTAIIITYVQAVVYFVLSLAPLASGPTGAAALPWPFGWLCGGNPYFAVRELQNAVMTTAGPFGGGPTPAAPALPMILLRYLAFHLATAVICLTIAVLGLRVWARQQASARNRRAFVIALRPKRLPAVGDRPVFWKEVHSEPLFRLGKASVVIASTLVSALVVVSVFVLICTFVLGRMNGDVPRAMNGSVTTLGTVLGCLMLLGVAIRAAGTVGGERDRQTLDSLLTTPVENEAIVDAKWWGSLLCVRKAGYFLLATWLIGVVTGGVSLLAFPLLVIAWLGYAMFAAGVGLWFSLTCRTTLRAVLWTLTALLGVSLGHWGLTLCCNPLALMTASGSGRQVPEWYVVLSDLQEYGLTPPVTLAHLTFSDEEFAPDRTRDYRFRSYGEADDFAARRLTFCMFGVMIYGATGGGLVMLTRARFADVTGRLPLPSRPGPRVMKKRPVVKRAR